MEILNIFISNFWPPALNIKNQCLGNEWSRKSNIAYTGKIDLGGRNDSI